MWNYVSLVALALLCVGCATSCPTNCICYPRSSIISCDTKGKHDLNDIPEEYKILYASDNLMTTLTGTLFPIGSQLHWLTLHRNKINALPNGVFDNLPKLKHLELQRNKIRTVELGVFDKLTKLEVLYLDQNQITELPAHIFDNLSKLTVLNLFSNQITKLPDRIFGSLSKLTWLDVSHNSISTFPACTFSDMTRLLTLHMDGNNAGMHFPLGLLKRNMFLRELSFDTNQNTSQQRSLACSLALHASLRSSTSMLPQVKGTREYINNVIEEQGGSCRSVALYKPICLRVPAVNCSKHGLAPEAYFPVLAHGDYSFGDIAALKALPDKVCPHNVKVNAVCAGKLMRENQLGHTYIAITGLTHQGPSGIHICFRPKIHSCGNSTVMISAELNTQASVESMKGRCKAVGGLLATPDIEKCGLELAQKYQPSTSKTVLVGGEYVTLFPLKNGNAKSPLPVICSIRPTHLPCGEFVVFTTDKKSTGPPGTIKRICVENGGLMITRPFVTCAFNLAQTIYQSYNWTALPNGYYVFTNKSEAVNNYPVICSKPINDLPVPAVKCSGLVAYFPVLAHGGYSFGEVGDLKQLPLDVCPEVDVTPWCAGKLMRVNNLGHHYIAITRLTRPGVAGIHICFRT